MFYVAEQGDVCLGDVKQRYVPVLQHSQAHRDQAILRCRTMRNNPNTFEKPNE